MRHALLALTLVASASAAGCGSPGPPVICDSLSPRPCAVALDAAKPFAKGRAVDLFVVVGYHHCGPIGNCPPYPQPSGGWPLSAVVALRFVDRSMPLAVDVRDVASSKPVASEIGEDVGAQLLRIYALRSPSPNPS